MAQGNFVNSGALRPGAIQQQIAALQNQASALTKRAAVPNAPFATALTNRAGALTNRASALQQKLAPAQNFMGPAQNQVAPAPSQAAGNTAESLAIAQNRNAALRDLSKSRPLSPSANGQLTYTPTQGGYIANTPENMARQAAGQPLQVLMNRAGQDVLMGTANAGTNAAAPSITPDLSSLLDQFTAGQSLIAPSATTTPAQVSTPISTSTTPAQVSTPVGTGAAVPNQGPNFSLPKARNPLLDQLMAQMGYRNGG